MYIVFTVGFMQTFIMPHLGLDVGGNLIFISGHALAISSLEIDEQVM